MTEFTIREIYRARSWDNGFNVAFNGREIATGFESLAQADAAIQQCHDAETNRPRTESHANQVRMFDVERWNECPHCSEPITLDNPFVYDNGVRSAARADRPIVGCDYCYVNDSCPARCHEPHTAPVHATRYSCSRPGAVLPLYGNNEFGWCDQCLEWHIEGTYYLNGEFMCDPWEHGYEMCGPCGEWRDSDTGYFTEWGEDFRCRSCGPHEVEPDYDEDYDGEDPPTAPFPARCEAGGHGCTEQVTHFHPDTEEVMCGTCADRTPGSEAIPELLAA